MSRPPTVHQEGTGGPPPVRGCNVETRVSIMGDDPPLCGNRVLRGGVCSFHGRDEIEARKRMIEQNLRENERHAARIAVLEGRAEP